MNTLNKTPMHQLVDKNDRPYFLWDCNMTLSEFRNGLQGEDLELKKYLLAKLMRQAKPDDVFYFVSPQTVANMLPKLESMLGNKAPFWRWLISTWKGQGRVIR